MRLLTAVFAALLLGACAAPAPVPTPVCPVCPAVPPPPVTSPPTTARYEAATWAGMPGWPGDQLQASWSAWLTSCKRLGKRPEWNASCSEALALPAPDDTAIRAYFERNFSPWQIVRVTGEETSTSGLVTGYYEPLLGGGREAKPGRVPLYAVPDDMLTIELADLYPELKGMRLRGRIDGNKVLPYWSRAEIEGGKLKGKVLVWVDNAVDAFFLQIQGSGRVQLDDGSLMRVGYADQNGHPYKAIGKWLAERGELPIEKVSMQNIRAWGEANPDRLPELLNTNPSYVFFRELENKEGGPIGAFNQPLTDGASIAVDRKFIPLGTPVFLATTRPDNDQALQRIVHAQDTGGAIRGPVRADFFWGFGAEAGALAGMTKQKGQLWLLWPKDLALPVPP